MDLTGSLLIAPPALKGNFWYKTVILVTEHSNQGSVGLVLNKRSQLSLPEFGKQIGFNLDMPGFVYVGGPVNVKNLSVLHTSEWSSKNTLRINDDISVSSDETVLTRLAMGDRPEYFRVLLGICGWSPGQLLGEIKGIPPWQESTSWCLAKSDIDLVFGNDNKDQWHSALDRSGLEFAQNILA